MLSIRNLFQYLLDRNTWKNPNVIGDQLTKEEKSNKNAGSYPQNAPEFVDQSTETEVLVTGIKVVDLLAPYAKGGKIGLLGCWCWKNSFNNGTYNNIAKGHGGYSVFAGVGERTREEMIFIMK